MRFVQLGGLMTCVHITLHIECSGAATRVRHAQKRLLISAALATGGGAAAALCGPAGRAQGGDDAAGQGNELL